MLGRLLETVRFSVNKKVDYGEGAEYAKQFQAEPIEMGKSSLTDANDGSYVNYATSTYLTAPFDMMDFFALRSWYDSMALYRPDVNHRSVVYSNLTTPRRNSKVSMFDVACCEKKDEDNRDFHKTILGMMFYELVSCKECSTVVQVEKCNAGFPLTTMGRVTCKSGTALCVLKNLHGKLLTKGGLQRAADYFNSGFTFHNDPPTADDVASFLSVLKGTHCRTVGELNNFLEKRNIPLRIPHGVSFARAKTIMAFHYQVNCGLVVAAWEGSHRLYLQVALAQNLPLNGKLPIVPSYSIPKKDASEWVYGPKKIPQNSPLLQDAMVQLLAPSKGVNARDYVEATKKTGEEITKASKDVIELNCSCAFLDCVDALIKASKKAPSNPLSIKFLDNDQGTPFLLGVWKGKQAYSILRRHVFDNCWEVFLGDMFVKNRLEEYAKNRKALAAPAAVLANAASDGERKSDNHYRLEAMKAEIIDAFYDLQAQRVHIKPEMQKVDTSDYRMNCPVWLLAYLELLTFGCITSESIKVFDTYFGGPEFDVSQSQEYGPDFMLSDEFLMAIVKATNDVVSSLVEFYMPKGKPQNHPTYGETLKNPEAKTKTRVLLTHNVLLDIMNTVNAFGPNPVVEDDQYVGWATR
jgi:hypothetical protein